MAYSATDLVDAIVLAATELARESYLQGGLMALLHHDDMMLLEAHLRQHLAKMERPPYTDVFSIETPGGRVDIEQAPTRLARSGRVWIVAPERWDGLGPRSRVIDVPHWLSSQRLACMPRQYQVVNMKHTVPSEPETIEDRMKALRGKSKRKPRSIFNNGIKMAIDPGLAPSEFMWPLPVAAPVETIAVDRALRRVERAPRFDVEPFEPLATTHAVAKKEPGAVAAAANFVVGCVRRARRLAARRRWSRVAEGSERRG